MLKIFIFFLSLSLLAKTYTLNELITIAQKKDVRVKDFELTYETLKANLDQLNALYYPKITYDFGIAPMGEVDGPAKGSIEDMDFDTIGVGLQSKLRIVQPIYTFGKISTAKNIANKGLEIAKKKESEIKGDVKKDVIKAYNALIMITQIKDILSDGKSQLKKARKKLEKLKKAEDGDFDDEGFDDIDKTETAENTTEKTTETVEETKTESESTESEPFDENDLFKVKIYEEKLKIEEEQLKSLEDEIKFGLITLLGIETDFKIEDSKLEVYEIGSSDINLKDMIEYKMLGDLIEINKLEVELKQNSFYPNIVLLGDWNYKYSNVAEKQTGYDPYHGNSAVLSLGLRWDLDIALFMAQIKKSKLNLLQNKNRAEEFEKVMSVKHKHLQTDLQYTLKKIESLQVISKESKKWFLGNATDYYMGLGKAKDLLESLAAYQKSKIDVMREIYDYNIKVIDYKLFLGEK